MELPTISLEDIEPKDGVDVCVICHVPWPWEWEDHYFPCANQAHRWNFTIKIASEHVREPSRE